MNDYVSSTQIYAKLTLATMEEHVCTLEAPIQHVDVHQASRDQPAPMTSTTVPQPPVEMEAPVMMDMVPTQIVHVHEASMEQPAPMTSFTVTQPHV